MKNMPSKNAQTALAIGAHPDDIEFLMSGTLMLLREAGYEIHYLNIANGSCGSAEYKAGRLKIMRKKESEAAATVLGAIYHESLVDDLEIYYDRRLLKRLAAVIREINPSIMLIPSPQDYMEDHTNACRLAVSASFVRGMPNFKTLPPRKPLLTDVTLYHAMPHGLRDPLRRRVVPGIFIDTTSVFSKKVSALSEHKSQQNWLDTSQKTNQYLMMMESFSREIGSMSGCFKQAEGWRRHLHYGFCTEKADPLKEALGKKYRLNLKYETELEQGLPL